MPDGGVGEGAWVASAGQGQSTLLLPPNELHINRYKKPGEREKGGPNAEQQVIVSGWFGDGFAFSFEDVA